jgi:hypothetical protein
VWGSRGKCHDNVLLIDIGTATALFESESPEGSFMGRDFTPTAEERAQLVRADGSIRLCAEVRLFLD